MNPTIPAAHCALSRKRIRRASKAKRNVYNFKRANWPALKEMLLHTPWDLAIFPNDINKSLSVWTDLLFSAVYEHILTSGIPQGSILGPMMFLVYINDAPDYICSSSTIALFAADSKLYQANIQPGCGSHLQKDLDGLHKWSQDWSVDFNVIKCKVMHISKKKISSATNRNHTKLYN